MRVALITGANHGIGAATARALAADGIAVFLTFLRLQDEPDPAIPDTYAKNRASGSESIVDSINASGGRAAAMELDLSREDAATVLFDAAEAAFGPVDVLVNNATGFVQDTFTPAVADHAGRRLLAVSPATYRQQFTVDAMAAALLIAEFASRHIERGANWGRIVGLTSGGPDGFPSEVSYGAAKAAQENYTMSAAAELGRYGITANMVQPPVTDTGWVNDEVRRFVESSNIHHHVATPEEVAEVIAFLVSDGGRLITGNRIYLR